MHRNIATDEQINTALADGKNTVCAFGVSGGKDSSTLVNETNDHLDSIGFDGTRILVHSNLGLIEHSQSLEICERLSQKTGLPLIVVEPLRPMLERWEYRWECVTRRFQNLETVRISTWASSAMNRYCTSEEKVVPITRFLKKTYPGKTILNAVGIRREESKKRAQKPISETNKMLTVKTFGTSGITWHPIADFLIEDVYLSHRRHNFQLHEAYTKFNMSRVSCSFCVLAGEKDLRASLGDERNHAAFQQIARLEIASTFSFKNDLWLADLAPQLLTQDERESLRCAKERAILRRMADKFIPQELLFDKNSGFPAFQPNLEQSAALGKARQRIGEILDIPVKFTTAQEVYDRYAELLQLKLEKEARAAKKKKPSIKVNPQGNLFA